MRPHHPHLRDSWHPPSHPAGRHGPGSTPELAAAVSNAGGLGVLGAAACGPNQLRDWIRRTRALTDKPFGVDTLLPASVRRGAKPGNSGVRRGRRCCRSTRPSPAPSWSARDCKRRTRPTIDQWLDRHPADRDGPRPLSQAFFEAQMEVVIEEKVAVYAAGLGNPAPWMDRLKANGTMVMSVVGPPARGAGGRFRGSISSSPRAMTVAGTTHRSAPWR